MNFEFDFSEIYEKLESLEIDLLEFSKQIENGSPNSDLIHTLFRHAHNLKGIFALVQKNGCVSIIHAVESNFDLIRKKEQVITNQVIEKSLAAIDLIRDFLDNNNEDEKEAQQIIEQLNQIFGSGNSKRNAPKVEINFELNSQQSSDLQDFVNQNFAIYGVEKLIKSAISEQDFATLPILKSISEIGKIIATSPSFETIHLQKQDFVFKILFATQKPFEELEDIIFDPFHRLELPPTCSPSKAKFLLYETNILERTQQINQLCEKYYCFSVVSLQELTSLIEYAQKENVHFDFFRSSDKTLYQNPLFLNLNLYYQKKSLSPCQIADSELFQQQNTSSKQDLEDFLSSANEIIESLEQNILELEKTKSDSSILEIFRLMHNLKGDAAFVSLQTISEYAHHLESLYIQLKNKELPINEDITQLLLHSNDFIKNAIQHLHFNHINCITQEDVNALQERILKLTGKHQHHVQEQITDTKEKVFLSRIEEFIFIIQEGIQHLNENQASKSMIMRALQSMIKAGKYKHVPEIQAVSENTLAVFNTGDFTRLQEAVNSILSVLEDYKHNLYQVHSPKDEAKKAKAIESDSEVSEIKTMRINEQKIDTFYNLVGELLIARNSYDFLLSHLQHSQLKPFRDNLHLFSRLISDLQSQINAMRMIPLSRITQKFNRIIFDIAKSQNKLIEFRAYGAGNEIDKKVAEMLSEPLIHIIRNACDHGIELPHDRIRKGKPETGRIELNVQREGSNLILKISDDGAGIDAKTLVEKAHQKELDLSSYKEENFLNLIFEAGFSTKQEVTGISGRGVGMDIVKTTMEKLKGKVQVTSQAQKGTNIILTVPISIGVNKSLLVEADNQIYAFPFESILKTLKVSDKQIKRLYDRFAFHYKNEMIIISTLSAILHQEKDDWHWKEKIKDSEQNILVLKTSQGKIGVVVDKLHSNIELAIKPLPTELAHIEQFSGVSILGNGKVILIVNPEKIVN